MFPTPQPKLTQVILLKLEQLIHQVNKRLDRVTLLLLVVLLVVAGLRDQVVDRQVAVDMEEDTNV
jgi:TRAP-type mannitol/chloroaromatic compound transport system permease small subunit